MRPRTLRPWRLLRETPGQWWVVGTEEETGREVLVAAVEMEEDGRAIVEAMNVSRDAERRLGVI